MSDISEAALKRKQAFLKAKEEAGGANDLIESSKNRAWQVFFTSDGEIACFTNSEDPHVEDDWSTFAFTREQVAILHDTDLRRFRIRQDPKADNIYTIELKPLEVSHVSADNDFLYEIVPSKTRKFDIKCKITDKHLLVSMSKPAKAEYDGVYPISATVNGQRLLKFSMTAESDPHFVYHQEVVAIADLLLNDEIKRPLPTDLRDCSIYTNKLFDTYVRK